jgi:hypothetical protein
MALHQYFYSHEARMMENHFHFNYYVQSLITYDSLILLSFQSVDTIIFNMSTTYA